MPFGLTVLLQNTQAEPIEGTLRLGVIDGWSAKPAAPVPFRVPGHGNANAEFTVTVGSDSCNAHYPIHAIAEFQYNGQRLVAHPILILVTQLSDPPRAHLPVAWHPVPVPGNGAMGLVRLPLHRESLELIGGEEQIVSVGPETYESSQVIQFGVRRSRGESREALAMLLGPRAPSRRERVAGASVDYPLALPETRPIRFEFATATNGGTALFRVGVVPFDAPEAEPGAGVFEGKGAGTVWAEHVADLSAYAGKRVRLRLEAQASGVVEADWGEPAVIAGVVASFTPAAARVMGTIQRPGNSYEVRLSPGQRGLLDATVGFQAGSRQIGFHGFRVRVAGDDLTVARSTQHLYEVREEAADGRYRVRHRFEGWAGRFDLVGEMWVAQGALRVHFELQNAPASKPWLAVYLEEVATGPWNQKAHRVYAGAGNVIEDPHTFQLGFDGHRLATSFVGFNFPGISMVQGVDAVPDRLEVDPDTRIYTLAAPHAQTLTFLPAATVWDGAFAWRELEPKRAAAGVPKLAGRFVFDLWHGRYAESARALEQAAAYGIADAVVVWHNWQRWGYDYRLPDLYPPNPEFGTLEEFQQLIHTAKNHGMLFAPHDNYIDFYPDAEGFSYDNIVFNGDGTPRKAWYHSYRQAQSYRFRPDKLRPFVERNVRLIQEGLRPDAYFIDVWSSMGPWDFWGKDGTFFPRALTRQVWGETFDRIRHQLDGAPQISEAGHDQLIGWLDGAQANILRVEAPPAQGFVWPIASSDNERIPWEDAAWHDRFILHGAGYPDRYAAGLDERTHGIYSDDYMATEVLTGHPAMVADAFSQNVVRKYWLLGDLMRGLAMRRVMAVSFMDGNIHRQQVEWENGKAWVNRGTADWTVGGHILPQYGFYTRVEGKDGIVEAAIERKDGSTVEWSRSPRAYYLRKRADHGFRITNEEGQARLMPLPDSGAFSARFRTRDLPWNMAEPRQAEVLDRSGRVIRQAAVGNEGGETRVDVAPDGFVWRLR